MYKRLSILFMVIAISAILGQVAVQAARPNDDNDKGAVYIMNNDPNGNKVFAYRRAADGTLTFLHAYETGGRGSGGTVDPLGSSDSILLSPDHKRLFVVNAGSGDISEFAVNAHGFLFLTDVVPCGGAFPVSLATNGSLLYVLNAAGSGNVTGFTIGRFGDLDEIPGSTQPLSASGAGGNSISFSPDGKALAAAEKATNVIDVFPIDSSGAAQSPVLNKSNGNVPFGLTFTPQGALLVSEAGGGPMGTSAVSSYGLLSDDSLQVINGSVPTGFGAACWIVATSDGRFAYVSNTANSEISEVAVGSNGTLNIFGAISSGAGSIPLDLALSQDNSFLYSLTVGNGKITEFQVESDGSLSEIGAIDALPATSGQNGIAAF